MKISVATYVNLDSRGDKRKHMEAQLSDCGVPYFRTPGVVVDDCDSYSLAPRLKSRSRKWVCATLGCFLAHRDALRGIQNRINEGNLDENDYALILEDDVVISRHFWNYALNSEANDSGSPRCDFESIPGAFDWGDVIFFDNHHKRAQQVLLPCKHSSHAKCVESLPGTMPKLATLYVDMLKLDDASKPSPCRAPLASDVCLCPARSQHSRPPEEHVS